MIDDTDDPALIASRHHSTANQHLSVVIGCANTDPQRAAQEAKSAIMQLKAEISALESVIEEVEDE